MEHYFLGEMMRDGSVPAEGDMEECLWRYDSWSETYLW
jgi:hypothetical protein